MIDAFGRWFPDFPGQQPYQDPAYYRAGAMRQQAAPQGVSPVQQSGAQQYAHTTPAPVQGGFVRVQSEQEARAYPVAPGSSITFIDESRPYCYTKSVDMSQLDRPKFDRYRLVKEEDATQTHQNAPQVAQVQVGDNNPVYALKSDLDELRVRMDALERRPDGRKPTREEVADSGKSSN